MKEILFALVASLTFAVPTVNADISPTKFVGSSVVTVDNTEVQMESADVRIVWGYPCSLDADFVLNNKAAEEVKLELGFPVGALHSQQTSGLAESEEADELREKGTSRQEEVQPEIISILINDVPANVFRRYPGPELAELRRGHTNWYFVNAVLKPGVNAVKIRTRLQPSQVYNQPFRRTISYCISTGGRWAGLIGYERVEIKFPVGITDGLIQDIKPSFCERIEGDSVIWEFKKFEPHGSDWDVELEIYLPRVMARLAEMKNAYEKDAGNKAAVLRYAAHLFILGEMKGNAGFPPSTLNHEEFRAIRQRITDRKDAEAFERFYTQRGDGKHASGSTEWTGDRVDILRILADADYCETYDGLDHVLKGRVILEKFLEQNPKDADAWHLYLANFWRWSFAARGHWFGGSVASVPFSVAVKKACKNCPDDARIQAWKKSLGRKGEAPTVDYTMQGRAMKVWDYEFDAMTEEGVRGN
jgi:hypothetical protein